METLRVKIENEWEEIEFGKPLPVLISGSVFTSQRKIKIYTGIIVTVASYGTMLLSFVRSTSSRLDLGIPLRTFTETHLNPVHPLGLTTKA
jgi:hypothetical protein